MTTQPKTLEEREAELTARYEGNGPELSEHELTELRTLLNRPRFIEGTNTIDRVRRALHANGYDSTGMTYARQVGMTNDGATSKEVHEVTFDEGHMGIGYVYVWKVVDEETGREDLIADF